MYLRYFLFPPNICDKLNKNAFQKVERQKTSKPGKNVLFLAQQEFFSKYSLLSTFLIIALLSCKISQKNLGGFGERDVQDLGPNLGLKCLWTLRTRYKVSGPIWDKNV